MQTVEPELIGFAHELADAARAIIREAASRPMPVHEKADASPVTEVDRAVEARLREMIAAAYPAHGVLGEEFEPLAPDADDVWVLDPIDGTKHFMSGIAAYGTLLAFARGGTPVLGLVDQPLTGERWIGAAGHGTRRDGDPVRTRACPELSRAVIATSSPEYFHGEDRMAYERVIDAGQWSVYGGNCIAFAQLAAGFLDVAFETGVEPYDFCGLVPIVANAGGVISDWEGRPLEITSGERIVAVGDRSLHATVLERLQGQTRG